MTSRKTADWISIIRQIMYGNSITSLSITNNRKYSTTDNYLFYTASRIILPVIHGWASLFGNYFAMTIRGSIHSCIIPVLCAKPYKRGDYANGKTVITFNDLPEVVAQLRDEVMSLRNLLTEQRSVNNAKAVDTHVPMSVEEAAEYLGIPKGTLYMKLSEGSIPATKPGKRYCLYRDELDKWLESSRKNPVPLSDEELSESLSSSHRRKPAPRNW